MKIKFTKMHGTGNDYLYVDMITNKYRLDPAALSKKISDRHFGAGSDGLILIMSSERADFKMRMFNADGSEGEMCGNGIRAFAKYCYDHKLTDKKTITVETLAGLKKIELNIRNGKAQSAKVDMGEPILDGLKIPTAINKPRIIDERVGNYRFTAVSMGNPHCVIFVDRLTDEAVLKDGPTIEKNPLFPKKTNVEFVKILGPNKAEMRVWERGSGETLSCGTGACAVAVACSLNNKTGRNVLVKVPGGELQIEWATDNHVYMTGPAEEVYCGEYEF